MTLIVHTSTVEDGSMYNRLDKYDPEVIANRTALIAQFDASLDDFVRLNVHFETDDFCRYYEVTRIDQGKGMRNDDSLPSDALITKEKGVGLFLPIADCIGAVIYDPVNEVLALAHLGRHSLEQHGGTRIIHHLEQHYNSSATDLQLWLTPAAGKDVYPIWALENKGMKEAAFEQFGIAGVTETQINDNPAETTKDDRYYSYSEFLKGHRSNDGDHAIFAMMA
jgi:copper oxidase (laccase) domain-containing protein